MLSKVVRFHRTYAELQPLTPVDCCSLLTVAEQGYYLYTISMSRRRREPATSVSRSGFMTRFTGHYNGHRATVLSCKYPRIACSTLF